MIGIILKKKFHLLEPFLYRKKALYFFRISSTDHHPVTETRACVFKTATSTFSYNWIWALTFIFTLRHNNTHPWSPPDNWLFFSPKRSVWKIPVSLYRGYITTTMSEKKANLLAGNSDFCDFLTGAPHQTTLPGKATSTTNLPSSHIHNLPISHSHNEPCF